MCREEMERGGRGRSKDKKGERTKKGGEGTSKANFVEANFTQKGIKQVIKLITTITMQMIGQM